MLKQSVAPVRRPMPQTLAIGFSALLTAIAGSGAEVTPNEAAIRAGHNIAVSSCVACHVVSSGQTLKPVLGPGIPSFEEIANRPGTTAESLEAAMKTARWHEPGMTARLLPMSRLSDKERAQVAFYILSLRNPA
jgi:mono/diheme cytochrome c family protein